MILSFVILMGFFSLMVAAGFVVGSYHFWERLDDAEKKAPAKRIFRNWVIKGFVVPLFLWVFINAGFFGLPPLMPQVASTQPGFERFMALLADAWTGILVIGSYWGAVTFGWMLSRIYTRTEDRREFLTFSLICSLILLPFAVGIVYFGWGLAGFAGTLWLGPIVFGTIEQGTITKLPPMYSRAIAAMQFDKFDDAEAEVIKQLEKCEDDFDGWMILAELYATRFNDLKGAERTVQETCSQANVTASQVSVAFHRLADWQLNRGENPSGARRALEEICRRFPNSHLERMARLRINQLPSDREDLIEHRQPKTLRLPAIGKNFNEPAAPAGDPAAGELAKTKANRCVEKLQRNPDDIAAREELAVIFVQHLHQPRLGIEQLELLRGMPNQPEKKMAEWLGLIAAWQMRYLNDEKAARLTLEQLLSDYPETPQAFAAQKCLDLMDETDRIREVQTKVSGSS